LLTRSVFNFKNRFYYSICSLFVFISHILFYLFIILWFFYCKIRVYGCGILFCNKREPSVSLGFYIVSTSAVIVGTCTWVCY
jgi:hypothetical protein